VLAESHCDVSRRQGTRIINVNSFQRLTSRYYLLSYQNVSCLLSPGYSRILLKNSFVARDREPEPMTRVLRQPPNKGSSLSFIPQPHIESTSITRFHKLNTRSFTTEIYRSTRNYTRWHHSNRLPGILKRECRACAGALRGPMLL
jgi:hypothetical protein